MTFWHGDVFATNPLNPNSLDKATVGQLLVKRFKNQMSFHKEGLAQVGEAWVLTCLWLPRFALPYCTLALHVAYSVLRREPKVKHHSFIVACRQKQQQL